MVWYKEEIMKTKTAIGIGLLAGLVSALFPSIPTIYSFRYWEQKWFRWYVIIAIGLLIGITIWTLGD